MRRALVAWFVAIAIAMPAAAHAAAGVNLSWDECHGDQPTSNRTFACDTNDGAQVIVASFVAPGGVTQLLGAEIVLDLLIAEAIPDWWRFKASGSCRQSAMSMNFIPASPELHCRDPWALQGVGGITAYSVGYGGSPRRARIYAFVILTPDFVLPIEENVEYFAFNLVISNMRTTGMDACAGCSLGVRLLLNSIKLVQPVGVGDFMLATSAQPASNQLYWQAGATDPVRTTTWGSVKSLYR